MQGKIGLAHIGFVMEITVVTLGDLVHKNVLTWVKLVNIICVLIGRIVGC